MGIFLGPFSRGPDDDLAVIDLCIEQAIEAAAAGFALVTNRPWAPELSMLARSPGNPIAMAVPTRTIAGVVSRYKDANFTSRPPSFLLPRTTGSARCI